MGYDADLLKTGFDEDRIKAAAEDFTLSVMVVNTHEQQDALVKATTHGKKFFVTGGKHINSNYMFISAEMGNREREITAMEKGKKVRIEFHVRRLLSLCSTALTTSWMAMSRAYQQRSGGSSPAEGCASIKDGQHGESNSSLSAVCWRQRR